MKSALLVVLFAYLQISLAAPVTVWQTVTAGDPLPSAAASTPTAAASTPTAPAISAAAATTSAPAAAASAAPAAPATGSGFLSTLLSLVSDLFGSSLSGFSLHSFLTLLLGKLDSSALATASATSAAPVPTSTAASNPLGFLSDLGAQLSATTLASSATQLAPSVPSASASASPAPSSPGGIYDAIYDSSTPINESFAVAILDSHNEYRALHGVGKLLWDQDTYNYAKNNADNYDCLGVLTHTHGPFGENLAAGFNSGPSAVKAWYVEGDTFDYQTANEYNHFTQVVWKASTKVGCAYKDCRAQNWGLYVVCEYSPVGNVIGQERQNVLPPVSS